MSSTPFPLYLLPHFFGWVMIEGEMFDHSPPLFLSTLITGFVWLDDKNISTSRQPHHVALTLYTLIRSESLKGLVVLMILSAG